MAFEKWDWRQHPAPRDALQRLILPRWRAKTLPSYGYTPDDRTEFLDFLDFIAFEIKTWLDTLPPDVEIGTGDLMRAFVPSIPPDWPVAAGAQFYQYLTSRIGNCRYYGRLGGYWHDVPNVKMPTKPFKKYHNNRRAT